MRINSIKIKERTIEAKNLNVIVGSNGTGKTRLLHELYCVFTGYNNEKNTTKYWHPISFEDSIGGTDFDRWSKSLVRKEENNRRISYYSPFTQRVGNRPYEITETQFSNLESIKNESINFLRNELAAYLSVDLRLTQNSRANKNRLSQPPEDAINLLFRFPDIQVGINKHLERILNRKLFITEYDDPQLELLIAPPNVDSIPTYDSSKPQDSHNEFLKWKSDQFVSDFNLEGHGVRALVNILISHEMPTNEIIFIDEPESHLYPSIKRKFGRIIGRLSHNGEKQIFLVTHDSDFLQGIFDSGVDFSLIKLNRIKSSFTFSTTFYDDSKRLSANTLQSQYLGIPFLQCAIFVEGATDRLLYEHVFLDQSLMEDVEYSFISSSGKDSVCNPEKIAIDVGTPYAIIFDFDVLHHNSVEYLNRLVVLNDKRDLLEKAQNLSQEMRGTQNLKDQGINALSNDLKESVIELIDEFKAFGIFIVPVGTLESWLEIESDKKSYPEKFIFEYSKRKEECEELHEFLKGVEEYLKNRFVA